MLCNLTIFQGNDYLSIDEAIIEDFLFLPVELLRLLTEVTMKIMV